MPIMKIKTNNLILESMTKIFESKEKLLHQPDLLVDLKDEISMVSTFLDLEANFSALISVMICEQLMGETTSIRKLMKHMGFSSLDIIHSYENIKILKRKGWLNQSKRKFHSFKADEFEISKFVLDAVAYNDKTKLTIQIPDTLSEALMQLRQTISNYIGDCEVEDLAEAIIFESENYENFAFISNLRMNVKLMDLEKVILIWLASEIVYGREEFDLNNIIDHFTQDPAYSLGFKQRMSNGLSAMVTDGFIEFKRPNFVDFSAVILGDKTNDLLGEIRLNSSLKKKIVRYCKLIEPSDLQENNLYFNSSMGQYVQKIEQLLSEENYRHLMNTFLENGMKDCLTMLFHGLPGTGKTELVKQLALKHQRSIYQVDISSIKDMWVGESEKNLKKVFREYGDALKYNRLTPILLFNEADAILGLRTTVQHSVDQMYNSLQNILLQELEDMKGIFIATTNLINNIDGAFDRRLLYKHKFELPDNRTRLKILESHFPDMNLDKLKEVAVCYELSGGQIQNIKRKLMADQLLFSNTSQNEILFMEYVVSEVGFRNTNRKIGFK
jgi:SpoVK/Ycf46/Vps4 family AAA+-type ATPase